MMVSTAADERQRLREHRFICLVVAPVKMAASKSPDRLRKTHFPRFGRQHRGDRQEIAPPVGVLRVAEQELRNRDERP